MRVNEQRGAVPPDYGQVLYWKLTEGRWRWLGINLLALPLALVAGAVFGPLGAWAYPPVADGILTLNLGVLLLTIVLTLGLHELAHGLTMMACGAKPRYGVKWAALALYATAPGYAFTRNQYLAVILAPLAGLSVLAGAGILVFMKTALVAAWVVAAIINAAGACGDVYMAWLTARYPRAAYVIDEEDGMRIFLPLRLADRK